MSFDLEVFKKKLPEGARIVSNSEVADFLTCERKHFFANILNKESKYKSRSLNIGIIGHELLAVYYKALKEGTGRAIAYQKAMRLLTKYFMAASSTDELDTIAVLQSLLARYVERDSLSEYTEILAVEEDFYLPINEDFWYGMRLDLLVRSIRGRSEGNIYLVDHKFTYDFYTVDDLKLNPQTPKYIGVLRASNVPVEDGYLNQLRTRFDAKKIPEKADSDLFQMSPTDVRPERIKSAFRQQIIASERIIERRNLPLELQIQEALPVMNRLVCRNCPFKLPCEFMEDGVDPSSVLEANFVNRTYGYNEEA